MLRQPNTEYSKNGMEMAGFELGALGPEAAGQPMGRHLVVMSRLKLRIKQNEILQ